MNKSVISLMCRHKCRFVSIYSNKYRFISVYIHTCTASKCNERCWLIHMIYTVQYKQTLLGICDASLRKGPEVGTLHYRKTLYNHKVKKCVYVFYLATILAVSKFQCIRTEHSMGILIHCIILIHSIILINCIILIPY